MLTEKGFGWKRDFVADGGGTDALELSALGSGMKSELRMCVPTSIRQESDERSTGAATQVPAVIVRRILCFATIAQNIRLPACTNLHRLSSMAFTDGEYLMEPLHKLAMKTLVMPVA